MLYLESSPWVIKVFLLLVNFFKISDIAVDKQLLMRVYFGNVVFVVASLLPSMLRSVRNRAATLEYVQLSLLILANIYMFMCWGLKDKIVLQNIFMLAQFAILHVVYSQFKHLQRHRHILLFSEFYSYMHLLVAVVTSSTLIIKSPSVAITQQNAVLIMISLFIGEMMGCLTYVQYVIIKVLGELYESLVSPFVV